LDRELKVLNEYLKSSSFIKQEKPPNDFYCYFCQASPAKKRNLPNSLYLVWEHLAGQSHRRKVDKIWQEGGAAEDKKHCYFLTKPQFRQRVASQERHNQARENKSDPLFSNRRRETRYRYRLFSDSYPTKKA